MRDETTPPQPDPDLEARRQAYLQRLDRQNLRALWTVLKGLITPQPASGAQPCLFRWTDLAPALIEAGGLITAREAERRVLILENPGLRGQSRLTGSLYAGIQMVLPQEVAPAHRHAQSALRLMLSGEGAYTVVDGERLDMAFGDFVITPAFTWHDHGNDGAEPVFWLDGLDIPLVSLLDASFVAHHPEETQPITRPPGSSLARWGSGMRPEDEAWSVPASPVSHYPYARARAALLAAAEAGPRDPAQGTRLLYSHPLTGGPPMPSIATALQAMPGGFVGARHRRTDGTIYCCLEGHGTTEVAGETLTWGPRDVFAVPSWAWAQHRAAEDSILFAFSDRPVQQMLGLWRGETEPSPI